MVEEWSPFFDRFLSDSPRTGHPAPEADDQIVPSPLMPHLMFEWLLRRARDRWPERTVSVAPVGGRFAAPLPYDRCGAGVEATRYVSFADWVCPTHCIEPARCPAIGAPRTWEMSDAVASLAEELRREGQAVAGPALFVCRHRAFGVGMFAAAAVRAGDRLVAEAGASGAPAAVLVGTISSCHGALNLLKLGTAGRSIIRPPGRTP